MLIATDDRDVHDVTLLEEIARAEGLHPSVPNALMRLTLLAPDILQTLRSGRQPRWMNLIWFQRNPLPVDWEAQRP